MAEKGSFDIKEPKIKKEEILVVKDKYFHNKNVAIVTGASSGVGRATAIALAVNGLTVVGTDVAAQGGKETTEMAKELGGEVVFIKGDLTKDQEIEESVRQAARYGSIKFLANIAGIQHIDSIDNFPMKAYDLMMSIMLRAPFYLSKLCIPHIKKSEDGIGAIGNMCSVHGHIVTKNKPAYNITKFGLR
jgi:3-hydroxybutyrate dehydrogenase